MNIEFTHKNHLKFGWGDKCYNFDEQHLPFRFAFGPSTRPVKSFREECIEQARLIGSKTTLPIVVGLSGGLDSEVIVKSFVEAQVPFSVFTIEFKNGLNNHDIEISKKLSNYFGIEHRIIKMDIENIIKSIIDDETNPIISDNLYRFLQWKVIKLFNDENKFCVLGSGEQTYEKKFDDTVQHFETHTISSYSYMNHYNYSNAVVAFYHYTPEIVHSFVADPITQENLSNFGNRVNMFYDVKQKIYNKHWNTEYRPKYHGYEQVVKKRAYLRGVLNIRWRDKIQHVYLSPNEIFEQTKYRG